jgi:hypothetical protein
MGGPEDSRAVGPDVVAYARSGISETSTGIDKPTLRKSRCTPSARTGRADLARPERPLPRQPGAMSVGSRVRLLPVVIRQLDRRQVGPERARPAVVVFVVHLIVDDLEHRPAGHLVRGLPAGAPDTVGVLAADARYGGKRGELDGVLGVGAVGDHVPVRAGVRVCEVAAQIGDVIHRRRRVAHAADQHVGLGIDAEDEYKGVGGVGLEAIDWCRDRAGTRTHNGACGCDTHTARNRTAMRFCVLLRTGETPPVQLPKPKVASSSLVDRLERSPVKAGLFLRLGSASHRARVGLNGSQAVRGASHTVRGTVRGTSERSRRLSAGDHRERPARTSGHRAGGGVHAGVRASDGGTRLGDDQRGAGVGLILSRTARCGEGVDGARTRDIQPGRVNSAHQDASGRTRDRRRHG